MLWRMHAQSRASFLLAVEVMRFYNNISTTFDRQEERKFSAKLEASQVYYRWPGRAGWLAGRSVGLGAGRISWRRGGCTRVV